jgi:hypothetical protein
MSPYSGLVEFLEAKEVLKKSGNSLEYTSHVTGEVIKMFRKPWNANKDGALDLIMSEWDDIAVDKANSPVIEDPEDMSEEELNSLDENLSTTEE